MFLFVVVSRQTKNEILCGRLRGSAVNFLLKIFLCALCGSTVLTTLSSSKGASAVKILNKSVFVCVSLRLKSYQENALHYALCA
jgi:hypothetical protein